MERQHVQLRSTCIHKGMHNNEIAVARDSWRQAGVSVIAGKPLEQPLLRPGDTEAVLLSVYTLSERASVAYGPEHNGPHCSNDVLSSGKTRSCDHWDNTLPYISVVPFNTRCAVPVLHNPA